MTRQERYIAYATAALAGLASRGGLVAAGRGNIDLISKQAHEIAERMLKYEPEEARSRERSDT